MKLLSRPRRILGLVISAGGLAASVSQGLSLLWH